MDSLILDMRQMRLPEPKVVEFCGVKFEVYENKALPPDVIIMNGHWFRLNDDGSVVEL